MYPCVPLVALAVFSNAAFICFILSSRFMISVSWELLVGYVICKLSSYSIQDDNHKCSIHYGNSHVILLFHWSTRCHFFSITLLGNAGAYYFATVQEEIEDTM